MPQSARRTWVDGSAVVCLFRLWHMVYKIAGVVVAGWRFLAGTDFALSAADADVSLERSSFRPTRRSV